VIVVVVVVIAVRTGIGARKGNVAAVGRRRRRRHWDLDGVERRGGRRGRREVGGGKERRGRGDEAMSWVDHPTSLHHRRQ